MSVIELPRWDTDSIFPGTDSPELAQAFSALATGLDALQAAFDRHDVRGGAVHPAGEADGAVLDEVLPALNRELDELRRVSAYLEALVTTDAQDADAAARLSRLQSLMAPLGTLGKRLEAWVARVGADGLISHSESGRDHAFWLRRAERSAAHQMSEGQEDLAAESG